MEFKKRESKYQELVSRGCGIGFFPDINRPISTQKGGRNYTCNALAYEAGEPKPLIETSRNFYSFLKLKVFFGAWCLCLTQSAWREMLHSLRSALCGMPSRTQCSIIPSFQYSNWGEAPKFSSYSISSTSPHFFAFSALNQVVLCSNSSHSSLLNLE